LDESFSIYSLRSIDAATTSNPVSVFKLPFNVLILPITLTWRPGASICFAASADSPVITIPSLSSSPGAPQSTVKRSTGVPAGVTRTSGCSSSRPSSSIRFPVTFGLDDFRDRRFHYFFGSVGCFLSPLLAHGRQGGSARFLGSLGLGDTAVARFEFLARL